MLSFSTITKYSKKEVSKKKLIFDKTFGIIKKPSILTEQNIKNKNNFKRKFNVHIDTFYQILEKENINTNLFLINLQSLIIEEKDKFNDLIYIMPHAAGVYKANQNRILVLKDNIITSIYHELLHCASTKKFENGFISGFFTNKGKIKFGKGLSEGYTALLEDRYFSSIYKQTAYRTEKHIASLLEEIIGKDVMTKLYFEAAPNKLIKRMCGFCEEKDVYDFLIHLDKIYLKKDIEESLMVISKFLLTYYFNKMENLRDNSLISHDQFIDSVGNFAKKMLVEFTIDGKKYPFITSDKVFEILDELYNNTKKTI